MALVRIDHDPPPRQLALFATLWLLFFSGWGVAFLLQGGWRPTAIALLAISLAAPLLGLVHRDALRRLFVGSCYAVFPIGWVVSHILLAVVYYGVLTPIGLLLRLRGYDPLQRRLDRDADSYWREREQKDDKNRYFRQF